MVSFLFPIESDEISFKRLGAACFRFKSLCIIKYRLHLEKFLLLVTVLEYFYAEISAWLEH